MAASKTLKRPAEETATPCNNRSNPPKKKKGHKRTCVVCDTKKHLNQFPSQAKVSSHDHIANVCRPCYIRHLEVEIDSKTWDEVACPECPARLTYNGVENMADSEDFAKYERASIRATLAADPDFRFCLSTTCDSGQLHPGGANEPIFFCQACGHKHCVSCETNWHEGQTCEQYQAALNRNTEQDEQQSQQEVNRISKPCPQCHVPIQKDTGCDHMTCSRCSHQFCWICFAAYRDIFREGNQRHEQTCTHYRAPPSAEQVQARNLIAERARQEREEFMRRQLEQQRALAFARAPPAPVHTGPLSAPPPPGTAALWGTVPESTAQVPALGTTIQPVQPDNAPLQPVARQQLSDGPDRTAERTPPHWVIFRPNTLSPG